MDIFLAWIIETQGPTAPDNVDAGSFSYWLGGEQGPAYSRSQSPTASNTIRADGHSLSAGTVSLTGVESLKLSGSSTSTGTADIVLMKVAQVDQDGATVEAAGQRRRVAQAGLFIEAVYPPPGYVDQAGLAFEGSGENRQVDQAALTTEAASGKAQVDQAIMMVEAIGLGTYAPETGCEATLYNRHRVFKRYLTAINPTFITRLNEPGSGRLQIPQEEMADVDLYDIVVFRWRGIQVAAMMVEAPEEKSVAEAEKALATISGRGLMATLEQGLVYAGPGETSDRLFTAGETPGAIFRKMHAEALARGASADITPDFSDGVDSTGAAWTPLSGDLDIGVGQALTDLTGRLRSLGVDWYAWPDGRLSAYQNLDRDKTNIRFAKGQNIIDYTRERDATRIINAVLAKDKNGVSLEVFDVTSIAQYGRREASIDVQDADADVTRVTAQAFLNAHKDGVTTITVTLAPELYVPFVDYRHGDEVTIDIDGTITHSRIEGIGLTCGTGKTLVTVELETIQQHALERLTAMIRGKLLADVRTDTGYSSRSMQTPAAPAAHTHTEVDITDLVTDERYIWTGDPAGTGWPAIQIATRTGVPTNYDITAGSTAASDWYFDLQQAPDTTGPWTSILEGSATLPAGSQHAAGTITATSIPAGTFLRPQASGAGAAPAHLLEALVVNTAA